MAWYLIKRKDKFTLNFTFTFACKFAFSSGTLGVGYYETLIVTNDTSRIEACEPSCGETWHTYLV